MQNIIQVVVALKSLTDTFLNKGISQSEISTALMITALTTIKTHHPESSGTIAQDSHVDPLQNYITIALQFMLSPYKDRSEPISNSSPAADREDAPVASIDVMQEA